MFDFIGDVHGYGLKLEALLKKLGYQKVNGVYKHSERKAFFLGDYIDRGPEIPLTLQIVRSMVESGNALALMGNHEYNALAFENSFDGKPLRPHIPRNINQYKETLDQFAHDRSTYESHLKWFFDLPLFHQTEDFCAVHACWDNDQVSALENNLNGVQLDYDTLVESSKSVSKLHEQIEVTLKGKEIDLPEGVFFRDKDNNKRTRVRIKWWKDPSNKNFKELALPYYDSIPNVSVPASSDFGTIYGLGEKPVFFGHYWLKGQPVIQRENICCLDFSVAKGGHLAAYRFDGEQVLDTAKIIYV